MTNSLAQDIRERTIAFLLDDCSLAAFQDWLVGATWDVEEHFDPNAVDMTYDIKLALAEYSRGDITAVELRQRLREAIAPTNETTPTAIFAEHGSRRKHSG
jgi:hypothetical protein